MTEIEQIISQLQAWIAQGHSPAKPAVEALCADVLARVPDHIEALHYTALAQAMTGRTQQALATFAKLGALKVGDPAIHLNWARVLRAQRQYSAAAQRLEQALQLSPGWPPALGELIETWQQAGEQRAALERCLTELAVSHPLPDAFAARLYHLAAQSAASLAQTNQAHELVSRAIALDPAQPGYYSTLGNLCQNLNRPAAALAAYQKALELAPGFAQAWYNQANLLRQLGQAEAAVHAYRRACAEKPGYLAAFLNLGNYLRQLGRPHEALECLGLLVAQSPEHALAASLAMASVYRDMRQYAQARQIYQSVLAQQPGHIQAMCELGAILQTEGLIAQAEQCFRQVLALEPQNALAHFGLGNALRFQLAHSEASSAYRTGLRLATEQKSDLQYQIHADLLHSLHYQGGIDSQDLFQEHLAWARIHAQPLQTETLFLPPDPSPGRRLRIAYLGANFSSHATASVLLPIFRHHDRQRFHISCYSDTLRRDQANAEYQQLADAWHEVRHLDDRALAERIARDRIDIVVELASHIYLDRLRCLARKPAPLQISYLDYPNTTGMTTMDYRLSDRFADPPACDPLYTETLLRPEQGFLCYDPPPASPDVLPPPVLTTGRITLGSFNSLAKINLQVIEIWAQIMAQLPESRLILKSKYFIEEQVRTRLKTAFAAAGIQPERIELFTLLSFEQHMQLYNQIDIGLDTFPYQGMRTTCEALWMGVPVLVLGEAGRPCREGVSLLEHLGYPELIARTPQDYLQKTLELAATPQRIAGYKANLRNQMQGSILCQPAAFTRSLEAAYQRIWQKYLGDSGMSDR